MMHIRFLSFPLLLALSFSLHAQPVANDMDTQVYRSLFDLHVDVNGNCRWAWSKGDSAAYTMLTRSDGFLFSATSDDGEILSGNYLRASGWAHGPLPPAAPGIAKVWHSGRFNHEEWSTLDVEFRERLIGDITHWPARHGAPWTDMDSDGVYTPQPDALPELPGDLPFVIGEETVWFASNDGGDWARNVWGMDSIGIEFQHMIWGHAERDEDDCPQRILFQRFRVIHKGTMPLRDARIGMYADIELGDASDDLVGVDSTLGLVYVYNANNEDSIFGDPPAFGYLLLSGPIVPEQGSSGFFDFRFREGMRNLPLSAFTYGSSTGEYQLTPEFDDADCPAQLHAAMKGLRFDGTPQRDPTSNVETRFAAAGRPIPGFGWVDGVHAAPGHRLLLFSVGPFDLAPGDTQEVVIARIAQQGGSHSLADFQALFDWAVCVKEQFMEQFTVNARLTGYAAPTSMRIGTPWPQPVHYGSGNVLRLPIELDKFSLIEIEWTDVLGRRFASSTHHAMLGATTLSIRIPEGLPSGTAMVRISDGSVSVTVPVAILR